MIKEFWCKDLKPYIDSMLFDSGEQIAYMDYEEDDWHITVSLEVAGEVRVDYKGEWYRYPSDFPEELKERIKSEGLFDDKDLYVDMNNWFEYIYDVLKSPNDGWTGTDGILEEGDVSKYTEEELKNQFVEVIEWIKGE